MDKFSFEPWATYKEEAQPEEGFNVVGDYTAPANETEVRNQLQSLLSQLKNYVNDTVVEGVNSTDELLADVKTTADNAIVDVVTNSQYLEVSKQNGVITLSTIVTPSGDVDQTYVDGGDARTLASAKTYSDANLNTAKAYAETYHDAITTGVLTAGSEEITLSNDRITASSVLSFYTSIYGVNPKTVSVNTGSVVLTFDAQDTNMTVGVKIDGTL